MPPKSQTVTKREFNERFDEINKDIKSIKETMATKDDLKNFATKDDIKRLAISIVQTTDKINSIEQKMTTKDDIQRIITTMDNFTGRTIDHERKAETNTHRIKELEPKVESHEKRITALESPVSSKN